MVRAQQGRLDEAITEMEELMNLPEIRSNNPLDAVGLNDPTAAGEFMCVYVYVMYLELEEAIALGDMLGYACLDA